MKARSIVTYTNKFWSQNFGFRRLKKPAEITGSLAVLILKNSKPETNPDNISLQQLAAVKKNLQQDFFITVVPASKGRAVVAMDTVEYTEKVGSLLNDDNT